MHKDRHFVLTRAVRWFHSIGVVEREGQSGATRRFVKEVAEGQPGDTVHLSLGCSFLRRSTGEILLGSFRASLDPSANLPRDAESFLDAMTSSGGAREVSPPGPEHDRKAFAEETRRVMDNVLPAGEMLVRGEATTSLSSAIQISVYGQLPADVVELRSISSFENPDVRLEIDFAEGFTRRVDFCPIRASVFVDDEFFERFDPSSIEGVGAVIAGMRERLVPECDHVPRGFA